MNTDRTCGCKGFNSCLICEAEFGIESSDPAQGTIHILRKHLKEGTGLENGNCFLIFSTLTCQIIVQQIFLFFGEKNTYTPLLGRTYLHVY